MKPIVALNSATQANAFCDEARQMLLDAGAQHARALAVDDADLAHTGQDRVVQVDVHLGQSLVQGHAAHVAFHPHRALHRAGVHLHARLLRLRLAY